jgi:hypothetical protein|nr:MAG TPA: zinc-ribbon domain protein [Bacteriophage sp.]
MKIKYIKSKVVSSPKANWTDIDFYYDVKPFYKTLAMATCSHCKKRGIIRTTINDVGIHVVASSYCPACGAFMKNGCN